jgi:hypothetical protein
MSQNRHYYPESYVNGLNHPPVEQSPKTRPNQNVLPSTFQPGLLKRQQSLGYDKNLNNIPRLPDRGSIKTSNNINQVKRTSNGSYRTSNFEQQKRL